MQKTRIYIIRFMGIIMLLCGYLLSNQPDSKSVMHFDSDPVHPSVITKAVRYNGQCATNQTTLSSDSHSRHKSKISRYISFDVILPPIKSGYIFHPVNIVQHTCALPEQYYYLFYEEINPPPPKAC